MTDKQETAPTIDMSRSNGVFVSASATSLCTIPIAEIYDGTSNMFLLGEWRTPKRLRRAPRTGNVSPFNILSLIRELTPHAFPVSGILLLSAELQRPRRQPRWNRRCSMRFLQQSGDPGGVHMARRDGSATFINDTIDILPG